MMADTAKVVDLINNAKQMVTEAVDRSGLLVLPDSYRVEHPNPVSSRSLCLFQIHEKNMYTSTTKDLKICILIKLCIEKIYSGKEKKIAFK